MMHVLALAALLLVRPALLTEYQYVRACLAVEGVEMRGLPADPRAEVDFREAFVKRTWDGEKLAAVLIIGPSFLPPGDTGGRPVIVMPPGHDKPRIVRHELIHWVLWRQGIEQSASDNFHPPRYFRCQWGDGR